MKTSILFLLVCLLALSACKKESDPPKETPSPERQMYFPPVSGDVWDTLGFAEAGFDTAGIADLYNFLESNGTRAFIVLKNGRIVVEKYWGNTIVGSEPFAASSSWYWASAGKTLTALLTGIAQAEGLLDINDKTSDYLGVGWTGMPVEKENLIQIKHQLTMTTGLDYTTGSMDCTNPECLDYKSDAGMQWYYHNAPYTLLHSVIANASSMDFNAFTDMRLEAKIGMDGNWIPLDDKNVYWSTARDAARFGLLLLNRGIWETDTVMADPDYFDEMTQPSQDLNPSYGYLTWLNGKNSIIFPGASFSFNTDLSPAAPDDLYAAMGKNGQFIDVVPSENLVVIRMGEAPDSASVPVQFHDEMWSRLNAMIQ